MIPYFSIIISVYNKADYIGQTINSVLCQSFSDFEVIIVNDGSTDGSLEIMKSFNDHRLQIIDQTNQGASQARNQGISLAKSAYIALLDGDDLWDPYYLESIHNAIQKHPDKSVFTTAIAHKYKDRIVPVPYSFKQDSAILILDYFEASQRHSALSGSSIVFKKEVLDLTSGFDTTITSGEDTDLWIRIGLHFPIVFISKVLAYYVYNEDSLSNTSFNIHEKPKFDNYKDEEQTNHFLKKFLDRNRFSLAVMSKLNDDNDGYIRYRQALSSKNLSLKRRLIVDSPKWLIKLLLKLKSFGGKKLYYESL
ncbi:Glycosyl transferase family 2 [Formosa sp. Hel1_31_208]|uniref:glycosyltransferase family 2 protein n=1 Tax=Formosa sp. Hel1_31_208 TaxID=1798225 RepID=UPI00087D13C8|nr:glycosyltransferase family 2 protein [Formosa sp. Hel1_31_208]SDS03344.1 Glycosyl transferase family 2 [Formosa sp. Hel1_31_208]